MSKLAASGLVLLGTTGAASASPTFAFTLVSPVLIVPAGDTFAVDGRVTNTGSSAITGLSGYTAVVNAAIAPYLTDSRFGSADGRTIEAQFAAINLPPGDNFTFTFATFGLSNTTPAGAYQLFNGSSAQISLSDMTGGSPLRSAATNMTVVVPEPTAVAVLAAAAALLGRLRRC